MQDPDVALYWTPKGLSCWGFVWWRQFPFVMLNVMGILYWILPRLANSHRLRVVVLRPPWSLDAHMHQNDSHPPCM
jgi:hypothetical protein